MLPKSGELRGIRGIALDIDDTLSTKGRLTADAYHALWKLKDAGFAVVPITGRPAGWCDHIARFWPVDAVVGENGAFVFYMEEVGSRTILKRIDTLAENPRLRLKSFESELVARFPEVRWASDQKYREYDLAVDICEDVAAWSEPQIQKLLDFCHAQGAHAKLSSIHVNVWFGDYNKRSGFERWTQEGYPGCRLTPPLSLQEWIYVGDSPNDEPMFEYFKHSVGVSNIQPYLAKLRSPPRWVTGLASGEGFSELAELLIQSRGP